MEWKVKTYTLDMPVTAGKALKDAQSSFVFNAARPLPGHATWTGDFHHGSYYAAIEPSDGNAARYVQECKNLDGWLVLYKSEEDIVAWAKEWFLLEEGYALPADFDYRDMFQSFTNQTWGKERSLTLADGVFTLT